MQRRKFLLKIKYKKLILFFNSTYLFYNFRKTTRHIHEKTSTKYAALLTFFRVFIFLQFFFIFKQLFTK